MSREKIGLSLTPPDACSSCGYRGELLPPGYVCTCCGFVKLTPEQVAKIKAQK